MKNVLNITNLHVSTKDNKQILNGISLNVKPGEIHAIMGPNGSGKSTLAKTLMGHPFFTVTSGKIEIDGVDITLKNPDQKAKSGLFLGFQDPTEVNGVHFASFLRMAVNENSKDKEKLSPIAFRKELEKKAKKLVFNNELIERNLNEGFSGGEKKKSEILQLLFLKPKYIILDEPDSGLDVDGLKYIATSIKSLDYPFGLVIITHYQKVLKFIKPDFVHIMINGKIVVTGNQTLVKQIENKGYEQYVKTQKSKLKS